MILSVVVLGRDYSGEGLFFGPEFGEEGREGGIEVWILTPVFFGLSSTNPLVDSCS